MLQSAAAFLNVLCNFSCVQAIAAQDTIPFSRTPQQVGTIKYVVKHKSAKLLMTYAVGKLEAALNISHLILSTSSQRVS